MLDEFGMQEGILCTMKISRAKRATQSGMKTSHPIIPRATTPKAVREVHLKSTTREKREVVSLMSPL